MALGFETEGEINTDFTIAAQRAQRMIFSELSDDCLIAIDLSEVIGNSDYKIINLGSKITDLDRFTSPPTTALGEAVGNIRIVGDVLIAPTDLDQEIFLRYKRVPKDISIDDHHSEIDIPRRAEYLLPILTAAFFWLDDDEEKAAYYMSVYKTEAARLRTYPTALSSVYYDTTGWA